MSGKKFSPPWITYEIKKKLTRIRDRTHKKMKKSNSPRLKKIVKELNRQIQKNVRRSHWDHVNSLFAKQKDDPDPHEKNKRFWSYIKKTKSFQCWSPPPQRSRTPDHKSQRKGPSSESTIQFCLQ